MLSSKKIIAIVAMDEQRAVGYQGALPAWHAPEDMKYFRTSITGKTIVMGRRTYESIYKIYQHKYPHIHGHPLAHHNIIISSQDIPDACVAKTREEAVQHGSDDELWLIGGVQIYKLFRDYIDTFLVTHIHGIYPADTFLPDLESDFILDRSRPAQDGSCTFCVYQRK